jgi:hypothetical protein
MSTCYLVADKARLFVRLTIRPLLLSDTDIDCDGAQNWAHVENRLATTGGSDSVEEQKKMGGWGIRTLGRPQKPPKPDKTSQIRGLSARRAFYRLRPFALNFDPVLTPLLTPVGERFRLYKKSPATSRTRRKEQNDFCRGTGKGEEERRGRARTQAAAGT